MINKSTARKWFNSNEVAEFCGVSLRQLQWWDEHHVVSPKQKDHRRIYMPKELVEISVIAALRSKGISLQKTRRVIRFLQKQNISEALELRAERADLHLITDGKATYIEDSPTRIIDLLKNARQPMFLVCITDQARRIPVAEVAAA